MHLIDLDRLVEVWGTEWEQIEETGDLIDKDQFLFTLSGGQVFVLNHKFPNDIRFWANGHGQTTDLIDFKSITRVVYSKSRKALAIESKGKDLFSDMLIKSDGSYSIEVSKSVDKYEASYCEILTKETDI